MSPGPGETEPDRGLRTAVVAPQADKYSETFIRDQARGLPGDVEFLYGGFLPTASASGLPPTYPAVRAVAGVLAPLVRRSVEATARGLVRRLPGLSDEKGLARHLEASGVEVVLAQYGPTGVAMVDVCRRAGVPLVVHFHGYDAYREDVLDRWGSEYRRLFSAASAVVAVSRDMVAQLARLGAPQEKLCLRPYGIDLDKFSRRSAAEPSAPPRVVAIGRFVDKKAPHLTVLAFRHVVESHPSAELHMVGEGPLLGACRTLAGALGIDRQVRFHGVLGHDDVAAWLRRADCFVQHSMVAPDGDSEGTPLSVLEAAATGLPVVATRHAGIPEVIEDGESGLLVEEGDVEGMSRALVDLLADPERAARMGRAARRRVETAYSRAEAIEGLYQILAESAREGTPSGLRGRSGHR